MEIYEKDLAKNVEFWRFLRIGEKELEHIAETGDLIICETQKKFKKGNENKLDIICIIVRLMSETEKEKTELYLMRVGHSLHNGI